MTRIVLLRDNTDADDLPLETWQALTQGHLVAPPGAPFADRLRDAGLAVEVLGEAEGAAADGLARRNLLADHGHGSVPPEASARAERLEALAARHGTVVCVGTDEGLTRAVVALGMRGGVEVELVVPPQRRGRSLLRLVEVMARLRGPGGCPWDAEQTHETLAKHLLDETYEVLQAIEEGTPRELAEELGDLLLQVVFHAQMGADAGAFDIDEVARGLIDKLVRRHPHVFGDVEVAGADEVVRNWDRIKHEEKQRESALEGVPEAMPALAYAQKLQRRASAAGFDWRSPEGTLGKVREEAEELVRAASAEERERELGDLLLSVTALARHLEVDAESALRRAARRFRDRLTAVERAAAARGRSMRELTEDELIGLWREVKDD